MESVYPALSPQMKNQKGNHKLEIRNETENTGNIQVSISGKMSQMKSL